MDQAPPNQIFACGKYISTATFLRKAGLMFFSWTELCTIENCIFQGHIFEFELEFQISNYHAEQSFASRKNALQIWKLSTPKLLQIISGVPKSFEWGCSNRNLSTGYKTFQNYQPAIIITPAFTKSSQYFYLRSNCTNSKWQILKKFDLS